MLKVELDRYRQAAYHLAGILSARSRVVITTHVRPDGDAIGSLLGLGTSLKSIGKQVHLIMPSSLPPLLSFLPHSEVIEQYTPKIHDRLIMDCDVIVCVDFNSLSRLEDMAPTVLDSPAPRIAIDHHLEPDGVFAAMLHDTDATSTAELVFAFLALEYPTTISSAVATNLYTGILTDTGNFRFPRVCGRTHRIVAQLIDYGADPVAIHSALYDTNSPERIRLMGEVLRSLEVCCYGACALMTVTRTMLEYTAATTEDTEGFVQYTLTINGVRVGALLSEMAERNAIKVSLRSKGQVDVQAIAQHLGGGGHLNAAAAIVENTTLQDIKTRLLELVHQELERADQIQW